MAPKPTTCVIFARYFRHSTCEIDLSASLFGISAKSFSAYNLIVERLRAPIVDVKGQYFAINANS